jgi:hypothetical protein
MELAAAAAAAQTLVELLPVESEWLLALLVWVRLVAAPPERRRLLLLHSVRCR